MPFHQMFKDRSVGRGAEMKMATTMRVKVSNSVRTRACRVRNPSVASATAEK